MTSYSPLCQGVGNDPCHPSPLKRLEEKRGVVRLRPRPSANTSARTYPTLLSWVAPRPTSPDWGPGGASGELFAFALPQVATTTERQRPESRPRRYQHVSANRFADRTDFAGSPWDAHVRETRGGAKRRLFALGGSPRKRR